jgi:hypothetical protein
VGVPGGVVEAGSSIPEVATGLDVLVASVPVLILMMFKEKGRSPGNARNVHLTLMPPKIARFSIIV